MPLWLAMLLPAALAYIVGATPFGWLAGRVRGVDLRRHGSGNIGATNAVRVLGKGLGLTVLALDVLKGWIPVAVAAWWSARQPGLVDQAIAAEMTPVLAGLGAVLGHTFTFWLRFKGGKGVATSAGVMLALAPVPLAAALVVWAVAMKACRYVSLSSILAGWALVLALAIEGWRDGRVNVPIVVLALSMAVLVTVRHRANLARIAAGTEPKAGARKPDAPPVS